MRAVFSRSRVVFGVVCIALVLASGMAQAAHFHATQQADHDCALCVAAHHVAVMAAPITLDCISVSVAPLTAAAGSPGLQRAVFFRLSIRPPPARTSLLA